MCLQPSNQLLGNNPCQVVDFIIETYGFSLPLQQESATLYEFSLMLEELYQVPIPIDLLYNLNKTQLIASINKVLAQQKVTSNHKLNGKTLLVIHDTDRGDMTYHILSTLARYEVALVLLTESIPTWEQLYIKDFICCDFKNHHYLTKVSSYEKNVKKFDGMVSCNPHTALANNLQKICGLSNVFSRDMLPPGRSRIEEIRRLSNEQ